MDNSALDTIDLKLQDLATSTNINDLLTEEQSNAVGRLCREGYMQDRMSRHEWERQMRDAFELALQVCEKKTFPWDGASNVKHPLITIATLQWASRAYASLVRPPDIIRHRVVGEDKDGAKAARAARVSTHMNYQITDQDEAWEEETDRLFMTLPIVGCTFRKTMNADANNYPVGKHVLATDFVLDYYAQSVETCRRKTHRFHKWPNEIREKVLMGYYSDVELGDRANEPEFYDPTNSISDARQKIEKTSEPGPRLILEQHCWLDLDGDDYEEPYIVTLDYASGKVLCIKNRFRKTHTEQSLKAGRIAQQITKETNAERSEQLQRELVKLRNEKPKVVKIEANEHFTKYSFIPAPDGGIYDIGFGWLLGPINHAVDTLINELIDAGAMQNQNSGFIGKGAKIPGGRLRFSFGEWKKVDVAGATLKESIVPLPVNPPSPVLFELLGLLITYGEKTASVSDAMTGQNPGQNTPAYGWQQMLTQGMAVYSGIYKRVYRAMRAEFRLRYKMNAVYLNEIEYYEILDTNKQIAREDYMGDPKDIAPVADPNTVLSEEKVRKVGMLAERAATVPGYDKVKVERMLLESMQIEDPDSIFPLDDKGQPAIQAPPPPDFQLKAMEEQRKALEADQKKRKDDADTQIKAALAAADVELKKAQTIKAYSDAGAIEIKGLVEQMNAATKRIDTQRQALKDIGDIENARRNNQANGQSMGGPSSNANATENA